MHWIARSQFVLVYVDNCDTLTSFTIAILTMRRTQYLAVFRACVTWQSHTFRLRVFFSRMGWRRLLAVNKQNNFIEFDAHNDYVIRTHLMAMRAMPAEWPKPASLTTCLASGNNSTRRVNKAGMKRHICAAASFTHTSCSVNGFSGRRLQSKRP